MRCYGCRLLVVDRDSGIEVNAPKSWRCRTISESTKSFIRFTPTDEDQAAHRTSTDRLGVAVQLFFLRHLSCACLK